MGPVSQGGKKEEQQKEEKRVKTRENRIILYCLVVFYIDACASCNSYVYMFVCI